MAKYTKRKDGRYEAKICTGRYTPEGKSITIHLYAHTIKELDQKVTDKKYEIDRGLYASNTDIVFKEYAQMWLETSKANRSVKTKEMYKGILDRHTELLTNVKVKDVTRSLIQKQVNAVAKHPRTCEQIRITLSQIFAAAVEDGIILRSPCTSIELPRKVVKEKRALTKQEKKAIRTADFTDEERAFIKLLYCTGIRPGECYALTWSDINFKTRTISISKSVTFDGEAPVLTYPKTNHGIRTIDMHKSLISALKAFKGTNNSLLLFGTENGAYRRKSAYCTLFDRCKRKIEKEMGMHTDLTAYVFRHNFASELYYSDVSLKEAIRLMGHADEKMIMRIYAHLDSEKEDTKKKISAINF